MHTNDAIRAAAAHPAVPSSAASESVRSSCPRLEAHACPTFDLTFFPVLDSIPAAPAPLATNEDGLTATLRGVALYNIGDLLGAQRHLAPLVAFLEGPQAPDAAEGSR